VAVLQEPVLLLRSQEQAVPFSKRRRWRLVRHFC
jgi:hypothetical protein